MLKGLWSCVKKIMYYFITFGMKKVLSASLMTVTTEVVVVMRRGGCQLLNVERMMENHIAMPSEIVI